MGSLAITHAWANTMMIKKKIIDFLLENIIFEL